MALPALLIDTNVLVACVRGGNLGKYIATQYNLKSGAFDPLICVVSVGEILSLARKFEWGASRVSAMEALLERLVVIDINAPAILKAYSEIDHFSEANGTPMGKNDVWIAAAAQVAGAKLLTTDKDFDHLHPKYIQRIWVDQSHGKST